MIYKLRNYQKDAVRAGLKTFARGGRDVLVLPTGCLSKGTMILMEGGKYKPVEQVVNGDIVVSYDTYDKKDILNKVSNVFRTCINPKPMIELVYNDEIIKTTYDHPFFDGERFYPLYQLVWREMEESQRIQLKLLCEQYGQDFNHTKVWGLQSCCNETCSRCERVFTNSNERENNKGSQDCCKELVGEPTKTSCGKSHQWEERRQQSGKHRMVHEKIQCLDGGKNRVYKNTNIFKKYDEIGKEKQAVDKEILFRKHSKSKTLKEDQTLRPTSKKISSSKKKHSSEDNYKSILVKEAEPYYSICMQKAPYTYYIGEKHNFITHNSGKSLIIASIAKELKGNTIVFQPSKEILQQNLQKIFDFGFTDVGVFSASMGEKNIGKITFATIGTVYNRKEIWGDFDNVIIDEAHLVNSKTGMYKKFIKANGGSILGLTATPYRLHSYQDIHTGERAVVARFLTRTRPKIFNNIIHVTQVKKLYEDGFLCPAEYVINDKYKHSDIRLNSTGMNFNEKALKTYNQEKGVIDMIVESITNNNSKHILVFNVFVEEAEELSSKLRAIGILAETVSANTKKRERDKILKDFKSGKIKVVTNVGIFGIGFDFPALDCIVLARPTQSVALYYQAVGRGIRTNKGKSNVKIIDICGNVKRFGRIETFEIVKSGDKGLLRLKSEVGYLTGYDFVKNQDLEKTNYTGLKESKGWNTDIVSFGKHKGTHIKKVPTDYLRWCVNEFKKGKYKTMFEKELKNRNEDLLEPELLPF